MAPWELGREEGREGDIVCCNDFHFAGVNAIHLLR